MKLCQHEINQVINLFTPQVDVPLDVSVDAEQKEDELNVSVVVNGKPHLYTYRVALEKEIKHHVKNSVYQALQEDTGFSQPWGSHTGVRPISLVHQLEREKGSVVDQLNEEYFWSEEKIRLANRIAQVQRPLLNIDSKAIDIYIGIPFCVSRCTYCSFSLVGIEKKSKWQSAYTDCLCKEIQTVGQETLEMGYRPRAIYVGGGTPTALKDEYLAKVLETINHVFPERLELTVEAGRPDTVTKSNLALIKSAGASRISINPQTMNCATLDAIGRNHTPEQVISAFTLARSQGFGHINMDLIAGLPGEGVQEFTHTLEEVLKLAPEAITIHTLAVKRSSAMQTVGRKVKCDHQAADMLAYAYQRLDTTAYEPYYLYRQKYMADNGENVGFSLPGKACLYNIDIMEENTHILAMGSGGVSKRVNGGRISRVSDPKDVEVYLERIDQTIERNINFMK